MAKLPPAMDIKVPGAYRDRGENAVTGLYIQITESRAGGFPARSWCFRYTSPVNGKARWMGLGSVKDVSLADARELARGYRKLVKQGRLDPITEREKAAEAKRLEAAKAVTFKTCAVEFIADHSAGWSKKHATDWQRTFQLDTAVINGLAVSAIGTQEVLSVLRPIWQERPDHGERTRQRIERVLGAAIVDGRHVGPNPAAWKNHLERRLSGRLHKVTHHPAIPYNDIYAFLALLQTRKGSAAQALELTLLTALRSGEVRGATWSEINLEQRLWTIPPSRMKGEREHKVPLSEPVINLLLELPRGLDSSFLFPGTRPGKPLSEAGMWLLMQELQPGFTVHGLRSSFRDWAGEKTHYQREVIEMALAHRLGDKTEEAYARGDLLEKRRRLMADWAIYCAAPSAPHNVAETEGAPRG
jgi:integrase